jgi:hypothetical protein
MLLTLLGWSKIISSVVDPVCFVDTIAYALLRSAGFKFGLPIVTICIATVQLRKVL